MLRVLIAVEDYSELLFLQTLLKKIGFDVEGVQNERNFEEARLSLNPEVILVSARGKRLKGLEFAGQYKKIRGFPKIILLYGATAAPSSESELPPGADAVLESPVNSKSLLSLLAELGDLDSQTLIEKYRKIKASLSAEKVDDLELLRRDTVSEEDAEQFDSKPAKEKDAASETRNERYKRFLETMEKPEHDGFDRTKVMRFHKKIRASEDVKEVEALEKERQAFVKALFKKDEES